MRGILIVLILVIILIAGFFSVNKYLNWETQNDQVKDELNNLFNSTNTEGQNSSGNSDSSESITPQTYYIDIKGYAFNSSILTIKLGDTVRWTNKDSARHTVTSDSGKELQSDYLLKDQVYSHTFNTKGTYKYHCAPHPQMKATVVVE